MNERIRKLAEQAGMYIVDDEFSTYGKFVEKFSELFVQECAEVLLSWKNEPFPFDEDLAVSLIKEHFGVK